MEFIIKVHQKGYPVTLTLDTADHIQIDDYGTGSKLSVADCFSTIVDENPELLSGMIEEATPEVCGKCANKIDEGIFYSSCSNPHCEDHRAFYYGTCGICGTIRLRCCC